MGTNARKRVEMDSRHLFALSEIDGRDQAGPRKDLLRIGVLALAVRLVVLLALAWRNPAGLANGDTAGYWTLAENLRLRRIFSRATEPPFAPDAFRTPGYPAFLWPLQGLGLGMAGVAAIQILISLAVLVLTYGLVKKLLGRREARIACLLVAFDPMSVLYAVTVAPEVLVTALLLGAVALASLRGNVPGAFLAGIVSGLSALVKPMALYLAPWLSALCLLDARQPLRERSRKAGLLLLAAALTLFPWFFRNWRVYGVWHFTSIQGYNLLYYNAAVLEAARTGRPISEVQDELSAELEQRVESAGLRNELRDALAMERLAREKIFAHPVRYGLLHLRGIPTSLLDPGRIEWARVFGFANPHWGFLEVLSAAPQRNLVRFLRELPALQLGLMLCYFLALLAVSGLACVGMWRLCVQGARTGSSHAPVWLLGALVYQLLIVGPIGGARFRVPMWPFVAALAAAGIPRRWQREGS